MKKVYVLESLRGLPGMRSARAKRQITMPQLSEQTQISVATLHRAEQCKSDPSASAVRAVSAALGVTSDELLGLTEAQ